MILKTIKLENCENNVREIDWSDTLPLKSSDVNHSFQNFFNKINETRGKHMP